MLSKVRRGIDTEWSLSYVGYNEAEQNPNNSEVKLSQRTGLLTLKN